MSIKDTLFALSGLDSAGNLTEAADKAYSMLKEYVKTEKGPNLTVTGFLKGQTDYTLMIDAHIDQIAMVVTGIDDNGFLTVAKSGGIDIRSLPSRRVTVHAKEKITAVFCATPPHLSSKECEYKDIADIKLDTGLGKKAKDIVSLGDYVTFSEAPKELLGNRVSGRSFDNRACVACVIETVKRLSDKELPFNVAFVLSDGEELGLRGTRTATFKINPKEAIVLDVSFGDGIDIPDTDCGKLGLGGMIGVSPALDRKISDKLIFLAKENKIPYQIEAMGAKSGTNADMISVSREGVRTCTLSIPLRNMHTDVETLDLNDLENVCRLLCEYVLSGGVMNA